jgi:hypothetical protein
VGNGLSPVVPTAADLPVPPPPPAPAAYVPVGPVFHVGVALISVENAGAAWNQTGGTVAESVATRSLRTIEPDKRILGCQTAV